MLIAVEGNAPAVFLPDFRLIPESRRLSKFQQHGIAVQRNDSNQRLDAICAQNLLHPIPALDIHMIGRIVQSDQVYGLPLRISACLLKVSFQFFGILSEWLSECTFTLRHIAGGTEKHRKLMKQHRGKEYEDFRDPYNSSGNQYLLTIYFITLYYISPEHFCQQNNPINTRHHILYKKINRQSRRDSVLRRFFT